MTTKILVLKQDSSRKRIESKGKHQVATVYGLDKVGSYQPTKDNKPSQAVVKAEELFKPEKEFESGSLVICGVQIGYVMEGKTVLSTTSAKGTKGVTTVVIGDSRNNTAEQFDRRKSFLNHRASERIF